MILDGHLKRVCKVFYRDTLNIAMDRLYKAYGKIEGPKGERGGYAADLQPTMNRTGKTPWNKIPDSVCYY